MNTERPIVSKETILSASRKVASKIDGDGCAEDIANCYYSHISGYELAKKLEQNHCWDIDLQVIEELEELQWSIDSIHKKKCMQWVVDDNIKPPFKNGTKIKEGVIKGVYEHDAAKYTVTEYGETRKDRHRIVRFEDAVEIK